VRNNLTSGEFRGFVVRQLTPSGVEAMRSFLLDGTTKLAPANDPDDYGYVRVREGGRLMTAKSSAACGNALAEACRPFEHPEEWLPASAWEDPVLRPFVPHSYQVGLYAPGSSPAEVLPAEAVDLLLGPGSALADRPFGRDEGLSRELAKPVATQLADVMDQAGPAYPRHEGNNLGYGLPGPSEDFLVFGTVLPHGGTFCDCG
jgi:hypothetical protein